MKWFVRANVVGTNIIELWHLSSEVKGEVRTNYNDEHDVEWDDECKGNDGNVHDKAPFHSDVRNWQLHGLDSIPRHRSDRLHTTSYRILGEDE
jgi:hypothetical protein